MGQLDECKKIARRAAVQASRKRFRRIDVTLDTDSERVLAILENRTTLTTSQIVRLALAYAPLDLVERHEKGLVFDE